MIKRCKFCGKEINTAKYISQSESSCGECTRYCMEKCEKVKTMPIALVGWHTETCKNCEYNPYVKYKIKIWKE